MAAFASKILRNLVRRSNTYVQAVRTASTNEDCGPQKGLVLGVFLDPETKEHKLTNGAAKFNNQVGGKLEELIREGRPISEGRSVVYQNLDPEYAAVAVVGLGRQNAGYNPLEILDECKENVRVAAAIGARALQKLGLGSMGIDGMGSSEAAAEGATLALWRYQECVSPDHKEHTPALELFFDDDKEEWERGIFKADAQNVARRLCDVPANLMTPPIFAQNAIDLLCPCGVGVEVFDRDWAEAHKWRMFLHVAKGSCEPPVVLKLTYCGGMGDEKPVVFIGSGITFDAGGLCLKKCRGMAKYRGDMAGAAVIVAVMRAIAMLSLPINASAIIPVCENLPSGMSMRPGDIIRSMNNKSVLIDDTDNEGRLLIADGLAYTAQSFTPRLVVDLGTLTEGMVDAVGSAASGVYTTNTELWKELSKAGAITGDRVWRFPLWKYFTKKVTSIRNADVSNKGYGPGGGPCRAAAFLREFSECGEWIHMDIAGTGMLMETEESPYMAAQRMSGRPVRLLIQFLYQMACPGKTEAD